METKDIQPLKTAGMVAAQALWGAADLIETEGWIRGASNLPNGDGTQSRCLLGALCKSVMGVEFDDPQRATLVGASQREIYHTAYEAVTEQMPADTRTSPAWWNDYSAGSPQDVVDLLRGAAFAVFQREVRDASVAD